MSGTNIGARASGTVHIALGARIKPLVRKAARHYYMSEAEFVRLAVTHYLKNHTDSALGESLIIKEEK